MKNLILCSFLLLFVGYAQSQKNFKISFEVMSEDLGVMTFYEAEKACADLGDGWRLPTIGELEKIYNYKDEIGGFKAADYYSSTVSFRDDSCTDTMSTYNFGRGFRWDCTSKACTDCRVRAVRDIK